MEALRLNEAEFPSPEASQAAKQALSELRRRDARKALRLVSEARDAAIEIRLPKQAVDYLLQVLAQMAEGNAITIVPLHAELTTQQAADLLNVSRPFLVGLLEHGELPHRVIGTHRRVLAKDVLNYKSHMLEKSRKALDELTDEAQRIMGDDY